MRNAAGIAVYLTDEDKEKIAKMDKHTHVYMEARPRISPVTATRWVETLRRFGANFYRSAFAEITGQKGAN